MAAVSGMRVAVCGGGVIGSSITYFLSDKGVSPTLIERCDELCAASAKAGGFLALDWCDGNEVGPLARASFKLHEQLSRTLKPHYGYRRLTTISATVRESDAGQRNRKAAASLPKWLQLSGKIGTLGTEETTAQVHPAKFTEALRQASLQQGANVTVGTVVGLNLDNSTGETCVSGVRLEDGTTIDANVVVLAMGPWTYLAADWLSSLSPNPLPQLRQICGMKAHSIVLQANDPNAITPHAVFLQYVASNGKKSEPEIYPRPHGEVYVCCCSEDPATPPARPEDVVPSPGASMQLQRVAETVSPELASGGNRREQACLLPVSPDGLPLIGPVHGVKGLYVATGHSCWGILNAPATGAALADVIVHGKTDLVDLAPFDPARFVKRTAGRR